MKHAFLQAVSIGLLSITMAFAAPQDAVKQVRENADQVLTILKKANGSNDLQVRGEAERYALPFFDFQRMTALAVGRPWRTATPAQQQQLSKEFQTLLIRTYSGTMLKFKGAIVNVKDNPKVNSDGREIVVSTEVFASKNDKKPALMDYTMYKSGDRYRVYNISVEGASLVTVYRNQFNDEIRQNGIDGLIKQLRSKNGQ